MILLIVFKVYFIEFKCFDYNKMLLCVYFLEFNDECFEV